jgi:hypothetical protein
MNGAQVSSLIQLVEDTAAGKLPRDAAIAIAQRSFQVDAAEAERLLGSAGNGFEPPAPPPAPPPTPGASSARPGSDAPPTPPASSGDGSAPAPS